MFTRKRAITLIFPIVVLLVLATPSSANGIFPGSAHRRDHVDLKRMIKMRAPSLLDGKGSPGLGAVGAGNDPPVGSSSTTPSPSESPSPTPLIVSQASSSSPVSSTSPSTSASSSLVR
jgi:hypothetical protein